MTLLFLIGGFFVTKVVSQDQTLFFESVNFTSINRANVDSFEAVINSPNFIDTRNRVQLLNRKIIVARIAAVRKDYSNSISILMELTEELDSLPYDNIKAHTYYRLAYNHDELGNLESAKNNYILSLKHSLKNQKSRPDSLLYVRILSDYAILLANQGKLDSSEILLNQVIEFYKRNDINNDQKYIAIGNLIAINEIIGNNKNARQGYHTLIDYYKLYNKPILLGDAINNLGTNFYENYEFDSAIFYFLCADSIFSRNGDLNSLLLSSENLASVYADKKNYKSAYNWVKENYSIRDSIQALNSLLEIGSITKKFEIQIENDRQQRKVLEEKKKIERQANIQFFGIFLGILFLFIMIFLSGRVHLPKYFADGIVFFAFVLLFEFLLVVLDPTIESFSDGKPLLKLTCNVLLAIFIIPLHGLFEKRLKKHISK